MGDTSNDIPSPDEHARWLTRFAENIARLHAQSPKLPLRCPCCGCRTLSERGGFEICPVCYWEDDGQDDHNAEVVRGGPNGTLSLAQARANYREFGACDRRFIGNVRPPQASELPE